MKLLMTMKLSNRSMWNHIFPITNLENIEQIIIVRDRLGPDIDKVRYVIPASPGKLPNFLLGPIKLFHLIRLSMIEKPSLIHSYLLFPHGFLGFIAGKITRRTIGISLIAGPVETYSIGSSPIGRYSYCHPLPKLNFLGGIIVSILKKFDVITVTGTYTKNYLVSKGIDGKKIFILPHVVDDRFRPMNINKDYDVVFIGRLAAVKHVETLIKAITRVKEVFPSIRVAIVGDGEKSNYLKELTLSLGLTNEIDFVGFQTNTWDWYNRSRISVVTSEREGFPYTVIESLKCGVPVVSSNCGDVCDILEDSFNGLIVSDYQDYNGFSDAILKLLTHPEDLARYSMNALYSMEVQSFFSVTLVWERIISSIVEDRDSIK
jgi:glycosyltransferase involved in cell wall biosynthesis